VPGPFEGRLFDGMTILKGGDLFFGAGWGHLGGEPPVLFRCWIRICP